MSKIMGLIQKSVKRFMMKAIKTDGILVLIEIGRSVAKMENKMKQVDFWIRYFQEHINTIGCVELDGLDCREVLALLQELADKKVDKPNKMEAVAQLFGKQLGERFTVRYDNYQFSCYFSDCGFCACGAYDNPYLDFDTFILQDLLVGRAVIVDE